MDNHKDLNPAEVVYISILSYILASWLNLLNALVTIFLTDGMTLQTSHRKINCRKQDHVQIFEKPNLIL